jgi:hypothetical protein
LTKSPDLAGLRAGAGSLRVATSAPEGNFGTFVSGLKIPFPGNRDRAKQRRRADIHVFVGFEASSSEGVNLLCLFPGTTSIAELERIVGACGVTDLSADSPQANQTFEQLLDFIPSMGGIAVAAHACGTNGVSTTLRGQARVERVINIVQRWPDHFPPVTLAALKESRPTLPEPSAASGSPGVGSARPATLINPGIGQLRGTRGTPAQPRAVLQSAVTSLFR